LIGGTSAWNAVLQAEQRLLVRSLSRTEDTLAREREAVERAELAYRHHLEVTKEQEAYQRLLLEDAHQSALRTVAYESFKAQMALVDLRCSPGRANTLTRSK
jgi:hypothetical protein